MRHLSVPDRIEWNQRLQSGPHIVRREQRAISLDLAHRPVAPSDILLHPVDSASEREHREHRVHVAITLPIREVALLYLPVALQMNRPRLPLFLENRKRAVGAEMSQEPASQQRRMLQIDSLERTLEPF